MKEITCLICGNKASDGTCECCRKKLWFEKLRQIAISRGGQCLSTQCSKGHIWETTLSSVLRNGTWCPVCARIETKTYMVKVIMKPDNEHSYQKEYEIRAVNEGHAKTKALYQLTHEEYGSFYRWLKENKLPWSNGQEEIDYEVNLVE